MRDQCLSSESEITQLLKRAKDMIVTWKWLLRGSFLHLTPIRHGIETEDGDSKWIQLTVSYVPTPSMSMNVTV